MANDFPPGHRLLTAGDYRRVFSAPEHKAGQRELLVLARSNGLSRHRLGLAIAKKHVPLAVNRNRIKRLTRERFRTLPEPTQGLDIVVLTRAGAQGADNTQITSALQRQFQRMGIMSKQQ